jgi:hypothetical protein
MVFLSPRVCCVMKQFGLTTFQRRMLQGTTIVSTLSTAVLVRLDALAPSWLLYTMGAMAIASGVGQLIMRRRHHIESNVLSVLVEHDRIIVELEGIGAMRVTLADVRDVHCLSPKRSWIDRWLTPVQGHVVKIRYRDRARKVLFAEVPLQVGAPWMPELVDHLLAALDVPWYIDGTRCDDPAVIRAWLYATRATPRTGLDPRATMLNIHH